MIQPVPKSKKEQKSISRLVNIAISSPPATTEYLRWSEEIVGFNRADHPMKVPRPGHTPMVLKGQIGGYDIGRVFMDAGSGINLIYARTLKAMNISLEWLQPTGCSFHGIIPGSANYPLGKIELDVCFGDRGNFRRKKLEFESHGLTLAVSRNPWAVGICAVHGSAPLCISRIKNPRAKWSYHGQRKL
jgi:hypothetical protein